MERIITKNKNGDIACNNIIIYTSKDESEIGKSIRDSILTDFKIIKPKYYKYKDDNSLIEIWYDKKGIVLDNGCNRHIKVGRTSNWNVDFAKEITYEEAMCILEQKEIKDNSKDNIDKVTEALEKESISYNNKGIIDRNAEQSKVSAVRQCDDFLDTLKYGMLISVDYAKGESENSVTKKQNNNGGASDFTPDYYGARCKCGEKIDAYAVCDKYQKPHKGSAWHHAVKKLIRAGDGHKHLSKDIDEVIDSLKRWKEQINSQDDKKK